MLDDLAGDPAAAYRHIERSLRLVDTLGSPQAVTAQARLLVPLAVRMGDAGLAAQWRSFVESRGEGWTHFDGAVMAAGQNRSGVQARAVGAFDRAALAHQTALAWYTQADVPSGIAFSASCLGFLATERGDLDAARRHHAVALGAALASDDAAAIALALEGAATIAIHDGDAQRAAQLLGAADSGWSTLGHRDDTHLADVEAVIAATRAALGDITFEAEIIAGRACDARDFASLRFGKRERRRVGSASARGRP